ncbi:MAG TPA: S8 family serine peptidase [Gaiellaceae bacterium]|nr:S8 family serine peptidase [Gaiellaceae bacterium]
MAAFGRSLQSASHRTYMRQLDSAQAELADRIETSLPQAEVRWHYKLVTDGLAVALPRSQAAALARIPGVVRVWPNVRFHTLRDTAGPQQIGADKLWGPNFSTAGNGMKIGIIDDGLQATHPYFNPSGFTYPAGFPKGDTKYTTPKVIVQRTFTPPSTTWKYAKVPFDPDNSFHATHVAGIAAGDYGAKALGNTISGVAPNAYLGNYKALTIPTPLLGLDGNAAEIAAAIEAAVGDGMNVINLSIGEPEIDPSRDIVVQAIDGAAAAGVVPVVAAGNDFSEFGFGSVSSPGNAPDAITVAAATSKNAIAGFSSGGPTPVSLQMKPDVTAPGVDVVSSLPTSSQTWGLLSGTSMATPHVAGAAALLRERHPDWTVAQIKSALVQTGDPIRAGNGAEVPVTREGGGIVDVPRADAPLLFASPTGLSFGQLRPGATATRSVTLTDAGGGPVPWTASVVVQQGDAAVATQPQIAAPGVLTVTATAGATTGDVTGFVVLTRGTDVRRVPFWLTVASPKLAREKAIALGRPGILHGTTAGAPSLVSSYRYPTGDGETYPGPERVYRLNVKGRPANFGAVVLRGHVTPHVTFAGDENHLVGYTGLPVDLNPYRKTFDDPRLIAGAVLPAPGAYDIVFDSASSANAGPFTFRWWINDTTPPRLVLRPRKSKNEVVVAAADAGSGVDPSSIRATLDGGDAQVAWANGAVRIHVPKGRHKLVLSVSDYQETKNMEDVVPVGGSTTVTPNTTTLRTTVVGG